MFSDIATYPNPAFLDYRGKVVNEMKEKLGLSEWNIADNIVKAYNSDKTEKAFCAYNRIGYSLLNPETNNLFSDKFNKHIRGLVSNEYFENEFTIKRIGVRLRTMKQTELSLKDLVLKFKNIILHEKFVDGINDCQDYEDIGFNINLKDEVGFYNIGFGPMEKKQAREFFKEVNENLIPEVGIFFDVDYFVKEDFNLKDHKIFGLVKNLENKCYYRRDQFIKIIEEV